MSIQLKPETEQLVQEEIDSGRFRSIDELIVQCIRALREKSSVQHVFTLAHATTAEMVARLRAVRKGITSE